MVWARTFNRRLNSSWANLSKTVQWKEHNRHSKHASDASIALQKLLAKEQRKGRENFLNWRVNVVIVARPFALNMPSRSARTVTRGMSDFSLDQVDCISVHTNYWLADQNWSKLRTILSEIVFYKYLYFYESIYSSYWTSTNKYSYPDCRAFKNCLIFDLWNRL